jgi:RNA polymerase sigma-70 factor, ECF subfamily
LKALALQDGATLADFNSDPDVVLMLRVRDDDAVAFESLMMRHHASIVRLMLGWIGNQQAAEDLAQDVFLRVFRARKTYEPTAKFTTWLYRIANNVASNAVRDRNRRREVNLSPITANQSTAIGLEQIVMAASGAIPTRSLDKQERAAMVQQAVMALGERQRIALILSRFDGLSYQEIADTMNLSVKAVKSLLSRARTNLRLFLEPYIEEGIPPTPSTDTENEDSETS